MPNADEVGIRPAARVAANATSTWRAAMDQCGGTLVVHGDGTPAACTEELDGRCCPGVDALHLGGTSTCLAELGPDGCELCVFDALDERVLRHAVHVGRQVRGRRRCPVSSRHPALATHGAPPETWRPLPRGAVLTQARH